MRGKTKDIWEHGKANFTTVKHSATEIFTRDLEDINKSNGLLVNLQTAKSIGTPWEMGYSYAIGKPLFVVCPPELREHPFISIPSTGTYETLYEAMRGILGYYGKTIYDRVNQINHLYADALALNWG
jgi:hypothetical protein